MRTRREKKESALRKLTPGLCNKTTQLRARKGLKQGLNIANGMLLAESMHAATIKDGFGLADIPAATWRFFHWPKSALERLASMTKQLQSGINDGVGPSINGSQVESLSGELSTIVEAAARSRVSDKLKALRSVYETGQSSKSFSKLTALERADREAIFASLAKNTADDLKRANPGARAKDGARMGLGAVALMFAWNSFATSMDNRRATPTERIMKLLPVATSLLALIPQRPQIGIVSWALLFTNSVFDAAFWGPQARREERRGFDPLGDMKKKLSKKKRKAIAKNAEAKRVGRPVAAPKMLAPRGSQKSATTPA